ncbi:hypothetical protein [Rhizobium sp. MHM7A]|uniref:hypothetical protein n=1 Tax=Rhizobium sp. MHM7A TaxID=2583233 RepID=UPI001105F3CF|nr:hypothetical protein [Rhizobium sp. MHM7A]TLX12105.1 hypothetical protein FFR93_16175 [Rhizobium sp. MHM7A]
MTDRIDWRGMFKRVVTRMRDAGESQEMGARWMAQEASAAVFDLTEENKRLRAALHEIATTDDYRGLTAEEAMSVAQKALAAS